MIPRGCLSLIVALTSACSSGQKSPLGPGEPFRVRSAQFIAGELPGGAVEQTEAPDVDGPPRITALELSNLTVAQGQGGKNISGRATENAAAVGLSLEGLGSGYWVVPTRSGDPITGELTWNAVSDFDLRIPAGPQRLQTVALDLDGNAGPRTSIKLCVASQVPDNLNACDAKLAPPRAVISLQWDTNVDLDLQVQTPEGRLVTPKSPSTLPLDAGAEAGTPGLVDRDSNSGCVVDGVRRENLVWQTDGPHGLYTVFANLFDACKQPVVRFTVSVYGVEANDDGSERLQLYYQRSGELLEAQVNSGAGPGLFVTEFDFQ